MISLGVDSWNFVLYLTFLNNSSFCVVPLKKYSYHLSTSLLLNQLRQGIWTEAVLYGGITSAMQYPRHVTEAKGISFLLPFTPFA